MPRPQPVSDAKIKQRVTQLLNNCGLRPPSRVTVTCARGEVTLSGVLHNDYQRQPAMRAAQSVEGVRNVVDRLQKAARVDPYKMIAPPSSRSSSVSANQENGANHMAKKSGANQRHNKSEEIRKVIKSGVTKPSEVQAKLAERGIQVSPQMVSTVKSKMVARRSARRIGERRASANASAPPTNIKLLARFIRAVEGIGGVAEARVILVEMED
jgi:hypothetical protein